ncbi:TetR/AcrR family transcriptional regulator [Lewinella sp. 4G2]|uniref:TetR/AcrR family transcriptional regulator n=1 Tax=Lewinella sp. 4G2 TaxID=1803372 RepID=UPI0007B4D70D|nr:TetR/AcrR family transcriptional regulator [Lewinella sp. 4G2]OAV43116.1 hypothetical protein A3850_000780 [Lewinella sp. 4G2]
MARTRAFDEQTVLAKARDLFWERGFTATSIGDLEKALGISRSSLYQTFGGKRALYDATLAAYQHENLTRLRQQLQQPNLPLREALTNLFTYAASAYDAKCGSTARGCYVVNATTEMANSCADALNFVSSNREQFITILQEALALSQVRGELDKTVDAGSWANYLFVMYNGLQVVVQTKIERETLREAVVRAVDALPWVG